MATEKHTLQNLLRFWEKENGPKNSAIDRLKEKLESDNEQQPFPTPTFGGYSRMHHRHNRS